MYANRKPGRQGRRIAARIPLGGCTRGTSGPGSPGYSLVELTVGLALLGLLVLAVSAALGSLTRLGQRTAAQMAAQQGGYVALDRLDQSVRLAGFNLDPAAGEEPFPALPAYAGSRYDAALALQYRTREGERKQYVYHVLNNQLVEAWGPGADQRRSLTPAGAPVHSFQVRYFTHGGSGADADTELLPANLDQPEQRALIRRVAFVLTLDRDGDGDADYEIRTAAPALNNRPSP